MSRFGASHGSHVEPGLTPKRRMGLHAMNYPNRLRNGCCVKTVASVKTAHPEITQEKTYRLQMENQWIGMV